MQTLQNIALKENSLQAVKFPGWLLTLLHSWSWPSVRAALPDITWAGHISSSHTCCSAAWAKCLVMENTDLQIIATDLRCLWCLSTTDIGMYSVQNHVALFSLFSIHLHLHPPPPQPHLPSILVPAPLKHTQTLTVIRTMGSTSLASSGRPAITVTG